MEQSDPIEPLMTDEPGTSPPKSASESMINEPMPDIAVEVTAAVSGTLDRVGMSEIEIMLRANSNGSSVLLPAKAKAFVSLDDPNSKGIHMSRLYLALQDELQRDLFTPSLADRILSRFLESHHDTSSTAELGVSYQHCCQRASMLSDNFGWRHYPVVIDCVRFHGKTEFRIKVEVAYSSTCPCSAALSRQILQQKFLQRFANNRWLSVAQVNDWLRNHGSAATPHSQRSIALAEVVLDNSINEFPIMQVIDTIEDSLGTAVLAVVKRADEQEFARRNGDNLMFCEDAARRIKAALESLDFAVDFRVEAKHLESLHAHDAVAIAVKGVEGGLKP